MGCARAGPRPEGSRESSVHDVAAVTAAPKAAYVVAIGWPLSSHVEQPGAGERGHDQNNGGDVNAKGVHGVCVSDHIAGNDTKDKAEVA